MSRKKTPKAIKETRGTKRPDRENPNAPDPSPGVPAVPEWLSDEAKRVYDAFTRDLHAMGVMTIHDKAGLAVLSQEYAYYMDAVRTINEHGQTYWEEKYGGTYKLSTRPEVHIVNNKAKFVFSKLTEFGLTPASREKVSKVIEEKQEDPINNMIDGN